MSFSLILLAKHGPTNTVLLALPSSTYIVIIINKNVKIWTCLCSMTWHQERVPMLPSFLLLPKHGLTNSNTVLPAFTSTSVLKYTQYCPSCRTLNCKKQDMIVSSLFMPSTRRLWLCCQTSFVPNFVSLRQSWKYTLLLQIRCLLSKPMLKSGNILLSFDLARQVYGHAT